jgi:hypothetical protein
MAKCEICDNEAPERRKTCSKECSDEKRSLSKMKPYKHANADTEDPEIRMKNKFLLRAVR